jgi:two-component system sensor histidine kinase DegS
MLNFHIQCLLERIDRHGFLLLFGQDKECIYPADKSFLKIKQIGRKLYINNKFPRLLELFALNDCLRRYPVLYSNKKIIFVYSGIGVGMMNLPSKSQEYIDLIPEEKLKQELNLELEKAKKELNDIVTLIDQSQLEVSKSQQRNATISGHLQQIQAQAETVSKAEIRSAYDAALEAQQRLFVMRGQIDKLQSDRAHIEKFITLLEGVTKILESGGFDKKINSIDQTDVGKSIEMIIQAQEAERGRLARKMHDGPAQALSNFILQAEITSRLFDVDQAKAKEELAVVKTVAATTFQKVRDFIFDLRPMMLDDLGLLPTVTRYVDTFKEQSGIEVKFVSTGMEQRFESYVELMVFRAIQELLGNISMHSQATNVIIQMDTSPTGLRISIEDNGKGFDTEKIGEKSGMGLKVIRDRVQMLGGSMEVHSTIGQGSHILFQIPMNNSTVFA